MIRLPRTIPALVVPSSFDRLDLAVDRWWEDHLRGRPVVDAVMYLASAVGDHGAIWSALATVQAARRSPSAAPWKGPLLRAWIGLAGESALVNGPIKWVFRRARPVHEGERPHRLRQPRTSSFPSGHAAAAFFGAALLSEGDPWWPVYYAVAVVVAGSRVHVRIHHASDVLGGAIVGAVLGQAVRRIVPVESRPATRR
jgi:membrane-associated phospholipid phosphatase